MHRIHLEAARGCCLWEAKQKGAGTADEIQEPEGGYFSRMRKRRRHRRARLRVEGVVVGAGIGSDNSRLCPAGAVLASTESAVAAKCPFIIFGSARDTLSSLYRNRCAKLAFDSVITRPEEAKPGTDTELSWESAQAKGMASDVDPCPFVLSTSCPCGAVLHLL